MKYGRVSEVTKGGTEVLVNSYRLICREKVGGSQRIPLLTKEGESMENAENTLILMSSPFFFFKFQHEKIELK